MRDIFRHGQDILYVQTCYLYLPRLLCRPQVGRISAAPVSRLETPRRSLNTWAGYLPNNLQASKHLLRESRSLTP